MAVHLLISCAVIDHRLGSQAERTIGLGLRSLYRSVQGWKFMSCCQEMCQQASWLLIGCTRVDNQSEAQVDPTLDNDYNS